ncbi:MAG TPA: hypothetical protein VGN17_27030 [Bryobacteraceae bacterium]|jgi:hypothetical protein
MKWRLFICAALFGGFGAMALGAPWAAVVSGVGMTALLNFWQHRKKSGRA